ncbi:sensor histidine kinase [Kangsaoukella pontilimi]|uniref:sensor histidine kinase n=1 Tax=Kangsaoukella pontilimi TaxID=2691042 RepID=UPI00136B6AF1|nr:PAS domain-containing protein [Kangsaoukella pontilimi]
MLRLAGKALETAPFAALIFEPNQNLTLLWRNPAHVEMTATPDLDIAGRGMFEAFPPTDEEGGDAAMDAIRSTVRAILETGAPVSIGPYRYDLVNEAGDYEERYWKIQMSPIVEEGETVAILQIARDVTDRVLSEELSSAEKRSAVATTAVSYFTFDPSSGRFDRSEAVDEMFGFAPGEAGDLAGPFFERVDPEDLPAVYAEVDRVFAAPRGEIAAFDYRVNRPDGTERFLRIRGEVVIDPHDRRRKLVGTFADFTDIERQRRQLDRENQMKTALVEEANHRIKNSLMLSLAMINVERRSLVKQGDDASLEDLVGVLNGIAERIEAVSAVHGLMQMTASDLQVSLNQLIRQLVDHTLRSVAIGTDRLIPDLGDREVFVGSQPAVSLGLIINEMLTNALKYGFHPDSSEPIHVRLRIVEDLLTLEVSNTVLDPGSIRRIPSTGIGSRLVAQMAENLGATISTDEGETYLSKLEIDLASIE